MFYEHSAFTAWLPAVLPVELTFQVSAHCFWNPWVHQEGFWKLFFPRWGTAGVFFQRQNPADVDSAGFLKRRSRDLNNISYSYPIRNHTLLYPLVWLLDQKPQIYSDLICYNFVNNYGNYGIVPSKSFKVVQGEEAVFNRFFAFYYTAKHQEIQWVQPVFHQTIRSCIFILQLDRT